MHCNISKYYELKCVEAISRIKNDIGFLFNRNSLLNSLFRKFLKRTSVKFSTRIRLTNTSQCFGIYFGIPNSFRNRKLFRLCDFFFWQIDTVTLY